jgi:hypothetical protein
MKWSGWYESPGQGPEERNEGPVKVDKWDGTAVKNALDDVVKVINMES